MTETLLRMEIAKFQAALTILSSKTENEQNAAEISKFLETLRKESGNLITKMEITAITNFLENLGRSDALSTKLKAAIDTIDTIIDAIGDHKEYDEYLAAVMNMDLNMVETSQLIDYIDSKLA